LHFKFLLDLNKLQSFFLDEIQGCLEILTDSCITLISLLWVGLVEQYWE
jgi:hypothetical protein